MTLAAKTGLKNLSPSSACQDLDREGEGEEMARGLRKLRRTQRRGLAVWPLANIRGVDHRYQRACAPHVYLLLDDFTIPVRHDERLRGIG